MLAGLWGLLDDTQQIIIILRSSEDLPVVRNALNVLKRKFNVLAEVTVGVKSPKKRLINSVNSPLVFSLFFLFIN